MYIERIDENCETLSSLKGNPDDLVATFVKFRDVKKYPLLSGVEKYQDTYFNTAQIASLIKELNVFKVDFGDDVTKEIDDLIKFAKKIDIHEYLRFIGD